jgi:hypothetical protein
MLTFMNLRLVVSFFLLIFYNSLFGQDKIDSIYKAQRTQIDSLGKLIRQQELIINTTKERNDGRFEVLMFCLGIFVTIFPIILIFNARAEARNAVKDEFKESFQSLKSTIETDIQEIKSIKSEIEIIRVNSEELYADLRIRFEQEADIFRQGLLKILDQDTKNKKS